MFLSGLVLNHDPPDIWLPVAGIIAMSHYAWPKYGYFLMEDMSNWLHLNLVYSQNRLFVKVI
jgi:hypothetical protein